MDDKEGFKRWIEKNCYTLKDALNKAFDKVWKEGDYLKAECCGKGIRYWTGIMGSDMAKCLICGNEIRYILSPHVSPVLIDFEKHCTHFPSEEIIKLIGDKCWIVFNDGDKGFDGGTKTLRK